MSAAVVEPMYLTKNDAARYASVSASTIKRAMLSGDLRSVLIGSRPLRRTTREWIDEWMRGRS